MTGRPRKVILRTVADQVHAGYLPSAGLVQQTAVGAAVQLLDTSGRLLAVPLSDVRTVCYVRDFNLTDTRDPERMLRRTFLARPRAEGLWLRITFADADVLEGLAALDVSLADGLIEDHGLFFAPPDVRSNTQRIFVPRLAIASLQLLAVVTSPSKKLKPTLAGQVSLFPEDAR